MTEPLNEIKTKHETPRLFVRGGRDYSVDLLRSISCFMVVMIHTTKNCVQIYSEQIGIVPGSGIWLGLVGYRAVFVAPTVLFVMISGIFFLTPQRNVTARAVWTKNIPKLACAYIFWSLIYAIYRIYFQMEPVPEVTLKLLVQEWIVEPPHLWYIPMMLGLYMAVPLLRCISTSPQAKAVIKYGTILFVCAIFLMTFTKITYPYDGYYRIIFDKTPAVDYCQYIFWMMLGYYLYTYRPSPGVTRILYAAGVVSAIVYVFVNVWQFNSYGEIYGDCLTGKFSITSFFKNIAIFLLVINGFSKVEVKGFFKKALSKISGSTLMIYLCHFLILYIFFDNMILFKLGWNPLIVVWVIGIITYIAGLFLGDMFHMVHWKNLRNRILDRFFPERTVLVTRKKQ